MIVKTGGMDLVCRDVAIALSHKEQVSMLECEGVGDAGRQGRSQTQTGLGHLVFSLTVVARVDDRGHAGGIPAATPLHYP